MPRTISISLAGHDLELHAEHGVYWPQRRILFVADMHLGKEASFRRNGIPVPVGSTAQTLISVGSMLERCQPERLCVLGDMFHARSSLSPDVLRSLDQFLEQYKRVAFTLVRGNHDRHIERVAQGRPIEIVDPVWQLGEIALGHFPTPPPKGTNLYLCGHLHPAIKLSSPRETVGKLPCFWWSKGCLVLPAIGDFTGTLSIEPKSRDLVWFVADGDIHPHPSYCVSESCT